MFVDLLYEETLLYHFPEFRTEHDKKVAAGENPTKHILSNDNALKVQIIIISMLLINIIFLSLEKKIQMMMTKMISKYLHLKKKMILCLKFLHDFVL